jgi:hypothetical protein
MLVFILISLGITYVITNSFVLYGIRRLLISLTGNTLWVAVLLYCPACMGFWVGAALGAGGMWPEPVSMLQAIWRAAFAAAAVGALWSEYGPKSQFESEQPQFFNAPTEPTEETP